MNRKIIKSIIKNKLNKWIDTIKDEDLQKLVRKDTILTGGAIANMLLNEEVKDYDLYFRTKETCLAVANYYVNQFVEKHPSLGVDVKVLPPDHVCDDERIKIVIASKGVAAEKGKENILDAPFEDAVDALSQADDTDSELLEDKTVKEEYRPVFLSSNAVTLSGKIQLVTRFFGEPEEIHKNYDFVHCTNYYDLGTEELTLLPAALEALLAKELKYVGSKYPLCSIIRTRKFIKRGYHINAGQYLKMIMQLHSLDLKNVSVLAEQLVGVDSTYFNILINALKEKETNDPNYQIDNAYLVSIVDKIF